MSFQGYYGKVHIGVYGAQRVAVKSLRRMNLASHTRAEFEHEFRMMIKLKHENIVNIIGQCPQRSEGELAISNKIQACQWPYIPYTPYICYLPIYFSKFALYALHFRKFHQISKKNFNETDKITNKKCPQVPL